MAHEAGDLPRRCVRARSLLLGVPHQVWRVTSGSGVVSLGFGAVIAATTFGALASDGRVVQPDEVVCVCVCPGPRADYVRRRFFNVFYFAHYAFVGFFYFAYVHLVECQVFMVGPPARAPRRCSPAHEPRALRSSWGPPYTCWIVCCAWSGWPCRDARSSSSRRAPAWRKCAFTRTRSPSSSDCTRCALPTGTMALASNDACDSLQVGQYYFVNFPQLSLLEWHPFSVSCGPREESVELHIRALGDHTKARTSRLRRS